MVLDFFFHSLFLSQEPQVLKFFNQVEQKIVFDKLILLKENLILIRLLH